MSCAAASPSPTTQGDELFFGKASGIRATCSSHGKVVGLRRSVQQKEAFARCLVSGVMVWSLYRVYGCFSF